MHLAYIAIGTNTIDEKDVNNFFKQVHKLLEQSCGIIINYSQILKTPAWGMKQNTRHFFNMVVGINTQMTPEQLLNHLQHIEMTMHSGIKLADSYNDRLLDLDILFYDSEIIVTEKFVVPHPLMHLRHFCVLPMVELDAEYVHPVLRKTMLQIAEHFQTTQIEKIHFCSTNDL